MADPQTARGLMDDVAVLDDLVISHDTIVEGVHYRPEDPPETVGWKLAAVNCSDLAGKGATPEMAILSLTIRGDGAWERRFLDGLDEALHEFYLPLGGGDTTALPAGAPRVLGMTVIGRANGRVPSRTDGQAGETLWAIGTFGDAAAGLALLQADPAATGHLVECYQTPWPHTTPGKRIVPHVGAMMDVSDGLLLDAWRIAQASSARLVIDRNAVPIALPNTRRDEALRWGDDYQLLFTLPAGAALPPVPATCIGQVERGAPALVLDGAVLDDPATLGFLHG